MECKADEAVRFGAPDEHLGDRERKVRRKPQIEAERMRGEIREPHPGEKRPVVEDARIAEKRPVQAAGEPRDQAHADHVRESPHGACDHGPSQKKRYPEGYLFPQSVAVSRGRSRADTSRARSCRPRFHHNASRRALWSRRWYPRLQRSRPTAEAG